MLDKKLRTEDDIEYIAKRWNSATVRHFRTDCKAKGITKTDALRLAEGNLCRTTIARLFDGKITPMRMKTFWAAAKIVGDHPSVFAAKIEAMLFIERAIFATENRAVNWS